MLGERELSSSSLGYEIVFFRTSPSLLWTLIFVSVAWLYRFLQITPYGAGFYRSRIAERNAVTYSIYTAYAVLPVCDFTRMSAEEFLTNRVRMYLFILYERNC